MTILFLIQCILKLDYNFSSGIQGALFQLCDFIIDSSLESCLKLPVVYFLQYKKRNWVLEQKNKKDA